MKKTTLFILLTSIFILGQTKSFGQTEYNITIPPAAQRTQAQAAYANALAERQKAVEELVQLRTSNASKEEIQKAQEKYYQAKQNETQKRSAVINELSTATVQGVSTSTVNDSKNSQKKTSTGTTSSKTSTQKEGDTTVTKTTTTSEASTQFTIPPVGERTETEQAYVDATLKENAALKAYMNTSLYSSSKEEKKLAKANYEAAKAQRKELQQAVVQEQIDRGILQEAPAVERKETTNKTETTAKNTIKTSNYWHKRLDKSYGKDGMHNLLDFSYGKNGMHKALDKSYGQDAMHKTLDKSYGKDGMQKKLKDTFTSGNTQSTLTK